MKVLRFFCNILLTIAIAVALSILQVGVFDLLAAQSKDVEPIHISAPDDDDIAYFDSYTFWVSDIKENFKQEPKYRIRNWASPDWWKKGMKWADIGLDAVIAAIKPVVVPIAQINAVKNFHGKTINDYGSYVISNNQSNYEGTDEYNDALYELYVLFKKGAGETDSVYTYGATKVKISEYEYKGRYKGADPDTFTEAEFGRWVARNKCLYNTNWKLRKYNSSTYDKYYKKFISEEADGTRHIKTAAIILYYQNYLALIIAIIFVIKYPISFITARYVGKKGDQQA